MAELLCRTVSSNPVSFSLDTDQLTHDERLAPQNAVDPWLICSSTEHAKVQTHTSTSIN